MLLIGSHVSFKKDSQLLGCVKDTILFGGTTFMFYTGAPQNTKRFSMDFNLTKDAISLMNENGILESKVVVHAPYIINLANDSDSLKYQFSIKFLQEEIERCSELGINRLVLHPGSHVGLGTEKAIDNIVNAINSIDNDTVTILLETMAGKGTEVGSKLEEIASIINRVKDKKHIGVCLDTCHLSDAGYDIKDFDKFLDYFDKLIGVYRIGCVHVNDSKNICGAHKDRHENIGFGKIGFDTLMNVIYNKRLEDVPKILETPYVDKIYPPYKYEIEMIKSKKFDSDLLDKIRSQ